MRPGRPHGAVALAAAAVIGILALMEAAQVYVGLSLLGGPVPWTLAFRATAPSWGVFLLLVVPLLWWLDRSPTASLRPGHGAVHALVGLAFTTLHLAGTAWLGEALADDPAGYLPHFFQLATVYFVPDFLAYVAIVGAHGAVRRHQEDRRREVRAARLLADAAEARFRALKGQLRPDFLFNTLNAVAGLLVRGDAARGVETLAALSALLRACLAVEPGRPVPFGEEMERVAAYLSIQELRFSSRLHATCRVPDGARGVGVPALAVLSLVEAVVDGGLRAGRPFEVRVEGVADDGALEVRLERTDPPLEAAELAAVRLPGGGGVGRNDGTPAVDGGGVVVRWRVEEEREPVEART